MKLKVLFFGALLALAGSAFGATPTPAAAGTAPAHEGMCKTDPAKCQADAAKFDQWCQANQDKCTTLKAHAEKGIEFCSTHKATCEKHWARMHERFQKMKAFCDKNPSNERCEKWKTKSDGGEDDGGDMPPPR